MKLSELAFVDGPSECTWRPEQRVRRKEGFYLFRSRKERSVVAQSVGDWTEKKRGLVQVRTKPGRCPGRVSCQDTVRTQLTYP